MTADERAAALAWVRLAAPAPGDEVALALVVELLRAGRPAGVEPLGR